MSTRQGSFRQRIAPLHTWSGLIVGWLMLAIAVTGTMTVFRPETSAWMRPEVAQTSPPEQALRAAVAYLRERAPDAPGWYLQMPDDRTPTLQAVFADESAPQGYRDIALDPVTGRPDSMRETLGGEFLYRFHFELQLPYPWGRILASAAGMLMLITLVSGIIIHRRIFADFFTFRSAKGQRSWLDAHNVLGVLALPFHIMIAATGILTLVTLTFPWAGYAAYGKDEAALVADLYPGIVERERAGTPAPLADMPALLKRAQDLFDGAPVSRVSIENPGDAAATVTMARSDAASLGYGAEDATFDGVTGKLLKHYRQVEPARTTFSVLYGLHIGRFAPDVTRWLYFLCGLALSGLIATGLILWVEARRKRPHFGLAFVERVNVGMVTGLPLGLVALFWANRLLPPHMPDRVVAEPRFFFWAWGAALLIALIRPPRRAWPELSALVALGAAALPFLSWAVTGRGLWDALLAGDWLFLGADLLAFAFAAMFARITIALRRKGAPPREVRAKREAMA